MKKIQLLTLILLSLLACFHTTVILADNRLTFAYLNTGLAELHKSEKIVGLHRWARV